MELDIKSMKYPKKYLGFKAPLKMPVKSDNGKWYAHFLHKNGTTTRAGTADYDEEEHCQITCDAHNQRIGYSKKDDKKLRKKYLNVKKDKAQNKSKNRKKK